MREPHTLLQAHFTATSLRPCLCWPTAHACNTSGNRKGCHAARGKQGYYLAYEAVQVQCGALNSVVPRRSWFMLSTVDALPEVGPGVHQRGKKLGSGLLLVGHIAEGQLVRVVVKHTKVPLTWAFLVPRIAQY